MRLRRLILPAAIALAMTAAVVWWVRGWSRKPQDEPAPARQTAARPTALLAGTPSCSERSCHGGEEPTVGRRVRRDEYTTWVRYDKHASAYSVLFGKRSRQIVSNLGTSREAYDDPRCLSCHSPPEAASAGGPASVRTHGIGCEACHGPARDWLEPHTARGQWATLTAAAKKDLGMLALADPVVLAGVCAGCHVGAPLDRKRDVPARDAGHDLLAAGHPVLKFELTSALAAMPVHWDLPSRSARPQPARGLRLWAAGEVVSARAALELLVYRAAGATEGPEYRGSPWPEFAEYSCFSCHQNLRPAEARRPRRPGVWSWGTWYYPVLTELPGAAPGGLAELSELRDQMERPLPDAKAAALKARKVSKILQGQADSLGTLPLNEGVLKGVALGLAQRRRNLGPADWDLAEHLALAASALEFARAAADSQAGRPNADRQARTKIDTLLRELTSRPPSGPDRFEWGTRFDDLLGDVLAELSGRRP